MTDNEIKKALECCANLEACEKCPMADMQKYDTDTCEHQIMLYALDLINRQQADNERLKKLLEEADVNYDKCAKRFYTEAIKELMFNLDEEISTYISNGKALNVYAWLKNYVKEMGLK